MLRIAVCDDDKEAVQSHAAVAREALQQCRCMGEIETYTDSSMLLCDITDDRFFFDLILLDIEMPGMNGIETFRRMQRFPVKVPVIFLTASGDEEDVMNAIKLGAANYLKKPFFPQELLKRVAKELGRQ